MKKLYLLITIFALILLTSCSLQQELPITPEIIEDNDIIGDASLDYYDLNELVYMSDNVVKAKCVDIKEEKGLTKVYFNKESDIVGKIDETFTVYVYHINNSIVDKDISFSYNIFDYNVGVSYVLLLEKQSLVFYEEDRYLPHPFFAKIGSSKVISSTLYGQQLSEFNTVVDVEEYALNAMKKTYNFKKEKTSIPFTRSENIFDIVDVSTHVMQVQIDLLLHESDDRDVYLATLIDSLKGKPLTGNSLTKQNNGVSVVVPKASVEIGKQYILAVNQVNENSVMYVISSMKGIYDINQIDEMNKIISNN